MMDEESIFVNIDDDDFLTDSSRFQSEFNFDYEEMNDDSGDNYFEKSIQALQDVLTENNSMVSSSLNQKAPNEWNSKRPPTNEELDKWLGVIYRYYIGGGYWNTIIGQTIDLVVLTFFVLFVVWIFTCIDYTVLFKPIPPGEFSSFGGAVHWEWAKNMNAYFVIVLVIYGVFFTWKIIKLIVSAKTFYPIYTYFKDELLITDFQIRTMRWTNVIKRINETNNIKGIDALKLHHIASRILKRENYMIALFNNRILDIAILKVSRNNTNLDCCNNISNSMNCISSLRQFELFRKGIKIFSYSIVRCIEYGILNLVFDEHSNVRDEFLNDDNCTREILITRLTRRFRVMAIINLLLLPVIVIFVPIYTVFQYGEEIYKNPSTLSMREWSISSKWKFREYNELSHLFKERLRLAGHYSKQYLEQFPYGEIEHLSRFIAFFASSFIMFWLVVTVFNETVLFGLNVTSSKTVFWWIGVLSGVWAMCNSVISHRSIYFPEYKLKKVEKWVHSIPQKYTHNPNSKESLGYIKKHYQLRLIQFINEFIGIIIGPYVLWKMLPECTPKIIDFIRDATIEHSVLGKVCRYSVFDYLDEEEYEDGVGSLIDFGENVQATEDRVKWKAASQPQSSKFQELVGEFITRSSDESSSGIEMQLIEKKSSAMKNTNSNPLNQKLDASVAYFRQTENQDVDVFYNNDISTSSSGNEFTSKQMHSKQTSPKKNWDDRVIMQSQLYAEHLEEIEKDSPDTKTLFDHFPNANK